MVGIIQAYAHDLAWSLDGRQVTDERGVEQGGLTQLLVGLSHCLVALAKQFQQGARVAWQVRGEAAQAAIGFHCQAFESAFGKMNETHDLYLAVIVFQGFSKGYGTVPFRRDSHYLRCVSTSAQRRFSNMPAVGDSILCTCMELLPWRRYAMAYGGMTDR
ncbi:hypothetical protein D3C71_1774530 [compost metagenome]